MPPNMTPAASAYTAPRPLARPGSPHRTDHSQIQQDRVAAGSKPLWCYASGQRHQRQEPMGKHPARHKTAASNTRLLLQPAGHHPYQNGCTGHFTTQVSINAAVSRRRGQSAGAWRPTILLLLAARTGTGPEGPSANRRRNRFGAKRDVERVRHGAGSKHDATSVRAPAR